MKTRVEQLLLRTMRRRGLRGLAATVVQAGLDAGWLDEDRAAYMNNGTLRGLVRWLDYGGTKLLMNRSKTRGADSPTCDNEPAATSQLNQRLYQVANVRELLEASLMMLHGKQNKIRVVKNIDPRPPARLPAYPAELNSSDDLIDNATQCPPSTPHTLTVALSAPTTTGPRRDQLTPAQHNPGYCRDRSSAPSSPPRAHRARARAGSLLPHHRNHITGSAISRPGTPGSGPATITASEPNVVPPGPRRARPPAARHPPEPRHGARARQRAGIA